MDNNSGKGISHVPVIMTVLALYVGYKTFFGDNKAHKIYHIAAPAKDTLPRQPDTTKAVTENEWSVETHAQQPLVTKEAQNAQPAFSYKPVVAYSPKVAPQEEVVKNLLEQGETPREIARQTRLTKKEIRKIKRKKRAEERKDKKLRKKISMARQ